MLSEMELMCDRVGIINNGKLIGVKRLTICCMRFRKVIYKIFSKETKKIEDVLSTQYKEKILSVKDEYVEIEADDELITNINFLLAQNMVHYTEIKRNEVSLEDAFINITGGGGAIE